MKGEHHRVQWGPTTTIERASCLCCWRRRCDDAICACAVKRLVSRRCITHATTRLVLVRVLHHLSRGAARVGIHAGSRLVEEHHRATNTVRSVRSSPAVRSLASAGRQCRLSASLEWDSIALVGSSIVLGGCCHIRLHGELVPRASAECAPQSMETGGGSGVVAMEATCDLRAAHGDGRSLRAYSTESSL